MVTASWLAHRRWRREFWKRSCGPEYLAALTDRPATDDAVFTVDVGSLVVWAARYFTMNGRRRLVGSFNHGTMACALPLAIGAQTAFPGRQGRPGR